MRRPNSDHLSLPWRVHTLAPDFDLLDVWRFPIVAEDGIAFDEFLAFLAESQSKLASGGSPAALLFRLRALLGRVFGWDGEPNGATNDDYRMRRDSPDSVRHRLTDRDADAGDATGETPSRLPFDPVYRLEEESLAEIENATVHALMHLGRVSVPGGWSPQMAVYVKRRGRLGRFYMALIGPFRHAIVYPAMMRAVARDWPAYVARRDQAGSATRTLPVT